MRVLIYRSQGTDEMSVACRSVEEAINCFRADADSMLPGEDYEISLVATEMPEEQFDALQEM